MFKCSQRGEKVSKGHRVWLSRCTKPDTNHLCFVSIVKQSCNMNQSCNKTGDSPAEEGCSFTSVCMIKFPVLKPQTENSFRIPGLTFDPVLLPSVFSLCKTRPSAHPAREFPSSPLDRWNEDHYMHSQQKPTGSLHKFCWNFVLWQWVDMLKQHVN